VAERFETVLGGLESALEGMGETVQDMGEAVGAARGQLAHASHFSGELMDVAARLKVQVFRLAEKLESPAARRMIAAGMVLFLAAANALRAFLHGLSGGKRKLF